MCTFNNAIEWNTVVANRFEKLTLSRKIENLMAFDTIVMNHQGNGGGENGTSFKKCCCSHQIEYRNMGSGQDFISHTHNASSNVCRSSKK